MRNRGSVNFTKNDDLDDLGIMTKRRGSVNLDKNIFSLPNKNNQTF